LLAIAVSFQGCSTEKNTALSRGYHNLTSHYNVFFNARQNVKEGLLRIDERVEDEYTRVLPLFKYSNPQAANVARTEMETAVLKCSKLIAIHSITQKPKRRSNQSEHYKEFASQPEYNKWVDDAYLLMGQACLYLHDYHRALENFSYLVRKFKNEPVKYEAYLWMATTYITDKRYQNAREVLEIMDSDPWFPRKLQKRLELVRAYYHINQNQYKEAIPSLEEALRYRFPGNEEARYTFILAQLYASTENPVLAEKRFRQVIRKRPSYVMAFNARLNRASQVTGESDTEDLKKQLKRMLRDKKNTEFQDRIYYALGNVAMKEGKKQDALNFYKTSAAKSTNNNGQRALSCLTLARTYYSDEDYVNSQLYYDSTLTVIDSDFEGYTEISTRAASLGRLVKNLNIVTREDSLQNLVLMPERERDKLFSKWIREAQKSEQRQREREQAQQEGGYHSYARGRTAVKMPGGARTWYFYNPTTAGIGKSDFSRIWGRRKLEDNWRRANKSSSSIDEPLANNLIINQEDTTGGKSRTRIEDPKSKEYYLQDLPLTDSLMMLSNERLGSALFKLGRIYQSEFNDFNRAVDSYEQMNSRFPGGIYELPSFYELYKLNKTIGKEERANHYRNKIILEYPGSKYASFLINPNYFAELESRQDSINTLYQKAYTSYSAHDFSTAGKLAGQVIAMEPDSNILPKIKFIEVVSRGSSLDANAFAKMLKSFTESFPASDPYDLAVKIYDLVRDSSLTDMQQLLSSGYINSTIVNDEILDIERALNDEFEGKFSYEEDLFHYFIIALPKNAKIDINRLIFDIANYNLDYYPTDDFDIEKVDINDKSQLVVVRSLPNKEEGLIYFRSIIRKRAAFESLQGVEYFNFIASSKNYREILAAEDYREYLQFFMKNYSHFIGSDFPKNNLPDPMEMLARANKEEEYIEKGEYVEILPVNEPGDYFKNVEEEHLFVLIPDNSVNLRLIKTQYDNFNFSNPEFNRYSLKVEQDTVSDSGALVVSRIPDGDVAMNYFRKVTANRDLFSLLKDREYRNIIISRRNYEILKNKNNLKEYLLFFKKFYLDN